MITRLCVLVNFQFALTRLSFLVEDRGNERCVSSHVAILEQNTLPLAVPGMGAARLAGSLHWACR